MFRSNTYVQNGDGNSLASGGSFFTLNLTSTNPGDYDNVSATYPGPGSPVALSATSSTAFEYQTGNIPTQADMDAAYPVGTYQFSASNAGGTDTASLDYSADHYPQTLPFLSGTSYSALQNMNPLADQTVGFSPDVFDPASSFAYIFFTVRDNSTHRDRIRRGLSADLDNQRNDPRGHPAPQQQLHLRSGLLRPHHRA